MGKFMEILPNSVSDFIKGMEAKDIFRLSVQQTLFFVWWKKGYFQSNFEQKIDLKLVVYLRLNPLVSRQLTF